ncbi:MAG: radical SAM protein [Myxococcota bacterium]|nr:radical SAM protein [Myxococcota bacterium]
MSARCAAELHSTLSSLSRARGGERGSGWGYRGALLALVVLRKAISQARALRVLPDALLAADAPRARPIHMHLEHTTLCDHVCSTCIRAERIDGEVHMPVDEARGYIDAIAPRFMSLNGIGEPLLHPEWDVIARHAIDVHGASVGFATTGTLFAEQAERLCDSGINLVKVSFHGAAPRTFARLASGRNLEKVEHGIRTLLETRRKRGRGPEIRINYVVSEQSFREIPEVLRVAKRCGVGAIYFKGALVPQGRNAGLAGEHDHGELSAAVDEGLRLAEEWDVDTNLPHWRRELDRVGDVPVEDRAPPSGRCLIPWLSVFIRVDGSILPCCNCTFRPDEGQMGRIGSDGSFTDLWRGKPLVKLRSEMRSGDYSLKICQDCPDPVTLSQVSEAALARLWPGFLTG